MRQLMGINGETVLVFGTRIVQKLNEWMKNKNRKNPLRLMQTALTSLWCCAGWKFPSKLRIFSLPHHPPVGLHPSQGDKQNLFPAGTASYLWIHQVQSRSDWAVVRRSRWRIHCATIERFLSLPLFLFISLTLWLFDSSSLRLFDSSSLPLFVFSAAQDLRYPIKKEAWRASLFLLMRCHVFMPPFVFQNLWREDTSRMFYELRNIGALKKVLTFSP